MTEKRIYRNAPIESAIIDVQVESSALSDMALLAAPPQEIRDRYPESNPVVSGTANISLGARSTASYHPVQVGYFRRSRSAPSGMQVRQDGLTVSRGAPYESWESLKQQFLEIWKWYTTVVTVAGIKRIGVRYTNRILLPLPVVNFREYFNTLPTIGDGLPGGLLAYDMRLQIPLADTGAFVIFVQSMPPFTGGDKLPIILDIDVVRPGPLPVEELMKSLAHLHDRENEFFENSITDKIREIIS